MPSSRKRQRLGSEGSGDGGACLEIFDASEESALETYQLKELVRSRIPLESRFACDLA